LAAGFVPAVVEILTRRHPRASVQITDTVLDRLLRELRDRNIDLAIGTSIAPISDEDMESELLFRDRLVIVAGASSKWAGRRRIKLEELLGEPWTFPPAASIPSTNIANAFKSAGLACPRPTVPTDFDLRNLSLASRRALPHCASGVDDTLQSQKPAAQSVAGRIACSAVISRDRYDEKSHP
jgi:DNA-binding transcriptional LysR family regulator